MSKKIFILTTFLLVSILIIFFVQQSLAIENCVESSLGGEGRSCKPGVRNPACCPQSGEGIVPCGTPCCRCELCDFFVLINRIVAFVMFKLAPVIGILMLVVGGVMFLISSGNPATIGTAKKIIFSVIIGLSIIYSAYIIVGLILKGVGLAGWASEAYQSWWGTDGIFTIDCGEKFEQGQTTTPP